MSTKNQPGYGDERIILYPAKKGSGGRFKIDREIFCEGGQTTYWMEGIKDWVSWSGEFRHVQTLAFVASKDEAIAFMVKRDAAAVSTEEDQTA